MTDKFVIGYDKDEYSSALVVLRPLNPEKSMEYEEVCHYTGSIADLLYEYLCGVDTVNKVEPIN